jgi:membrane protein
MNTGVARKTSSGWSFTGVLGQTFRGFRADRGLDLAASLSFASLLTAVPLLATFSLFLVTFFQENDDQILAVANAVLPYLTVRLTENLKEFITESTAISGVGLVLLVLASVRLVFVVEGVFNAVWGAPRRRARLSRILLYTFALVALGLVLGGIGWGMRALRRAAEADAAVNSALVGAAVPFILKAFFLTLLYRYLPNARVRLSAAAVAGCAAALGLELLRLGFGVYVETLLRMNLITGSLAFALFAILSLYFAWALILLGVELTHVLQMEVGGARGGRQQEGRAEKAVRMLLRLSRADPAPIKDIETDRDLAPAETVAILDDLALAGLVEGNAEKGYRLAMSGRDITVAHIVEALVPGLYHVSPREDRVAMILEPLFYRLDSERRVLLNTTLAELRPRGQETGVLRKPGP